MKKITFGVPEEYVPSKFCKGFYYEQGKVAYPVEKIAFNINDRGCQLELPMDRDEQFYGLGLQLQQFNLRGRHAKLTVNSDPIAPTGDSHAPVPFFVSTKGYGIYFDTARYVEFDFARVKKQDLITKQAHTQVGVSTDEIYALKTTDSKEVISVQIPCAKGIEIYIIEGKNITEVVSQYNIYQVLFCIFDWNDAILLDLCNIFST